MKIIQKIIIYFSILLIVLCAIFPIYWMLNTALQKDSDLFLKTPKFFPNFNQLHVFLDLFQTHLIGNWLINSIILAVCVSIICVSISILAGYSISRYQFFARNFISFIFLLIQMLPTVLLVVPIFIIFKKMNLYNNLIGLIIVDSAFAFSICVWIMKGYFDTIPREIEEAALIDGCNYYNVLFRISIPLAKPAIASCAIISFFNAWNEYMFASTFMADIKKWPASIGIASFIGDITTSTDVMMAGAIVFALPSILLFILVEKFIVKGLTGGSIK